MRFVLVITLLMLSAPDLSADIINVPDDNLFIQEAIDASQDGDTILVHPGEYRENIMFNGRSIVLGSLFLTTGEEEFIDRTIIDGSANGSSVIAIRMGESPTITGFTIQNGDTDYGGGIYCRSSHPTLTHLIVRNNRVERNGAGIYITRDSRPVISDVVISNNWAGYVGGGIGCYGGSTPILTNCLIFDNYSDHVGGGIHVHSCEPTFINVTVTGNTALHSGGAIYLTADAEGSMENCILWGNEPHEIQLASGIDDTTWLKLSHCIVDGGPEEAEVWPGAEIDWTVGNINENPSFNDADMWDFTLTEDSPCIDGGNPESPPDPDGTRADIGAFYFHDENGQHVRHVPDPFENIQEAIDEAEDGDIVLVQPGEYVENIDFDGKNIVVGSRFLSTGDEDFIEETIIDGDEEGSVVTFANEEGDEAALIGFTLTNGRAENGGGIYCEGANPSILSCLITDNEAVENGGGVYCSSSFPVISDCIISDNRAELGGGIYGQNRSELSVTKAIISGNTASFAGAIGLYANTNLALTNVTIYGNSAEDNGGGILCYNGSNADVVNSILWDNLPQEVFFAPEDDPNDFSVSYSDLTRGVRGVVLNENGELDWGEGNIDVDPQFVDPMFNDFHLIEVSPCIDAGDPESPRDPDRTPADMGALYFHQEVPRQNMTLHVPDQYGTIQDAINSALSGDTILVQPGVYPENVDYRGIDVLIASLFLITRDPAYIDSTVIDGEGNDAVVIFNSRESDQARLVGFSITNGSSREGGGIYCFHASPRVSYCAIYGNNAEDGGAGIFCYESNPVILNCTIFANTAEEGGGIFLKSASSPTIINSILWDNAPAEVFFSDDWDPNTFSVGFSDIEGGRDGIVDNFNGFVDWGDGNIDEYPLFENADENNYHLTENSPCIDAGDDFYPDDPDDSIVDMGAFYFDHRGGRLDVSISLVRGWNLISCPVIPPENEMEIIWAPVVARGNLYRVMDHNGRFYSIEPEFNNIPGWDIHQGYYARLGNPETLVIRGFIIHPDEPIQVREGWSLVAYYPEEEIPALDAFANIEDVLVLAKDARGQFYYPEIGFSNMGTLRQTQGYHVKVSEEVELTWNVPDQVAMVVPTEPAPPAPIHFSPPSPTLWNMSVLVSVGMSPITSTVQHGFDDSEIELAAFTAGGACVGAAVLAGESPWGLAIWGDDSSTEQVDGALEGDRLSFRIWDGTAEQDAVINWTEGDGHFVSSGFAQIAVELTAAPSEFTLSNPYPNPFNGSVRLNFSLDKSGKTVLAIHDLSGRTVETLIDNNLKAGYHSIDWSARDIPSGIYFVRLGSADVSLVKKVILVR